MSAKRIDGCMDSGDWGSVEWAMVWVGPPTRPHEDAVSIVPTEHYDALVAERDRMREALVAVADKILNSAGRRVVRAALADTGDET